MLAAVELWWGTEVGVRVPPGDLLGATVQLSKAIPLWFCLRADGF